MTLNFQPHMLGKGVLTYNIFCVCVCGEEANSMCLLLEIWIVSICICLQELRISFELSKHLFMNDFFDKNRCVCFDFSV